METVKLILAWIGLIVVGYAIGLLVVMYVLGGKKP